MSVQFQSEKKTVLRTDHRTVVSQSTIPSFKYPSRNEKKKKQKKNQTNCYNSGLA